MRQYFDNYFKFDKEYSALDDAGRDAHLNGKVAAALMENAPVILEGFDASAIQKINILASK